LEEDDEDNDEVRIGCLKKLLLPVLIERKGIHNTTPIIWSKITTVVRMNPNNKSLRIRRRRCIFLLFLLCRVFSFVVVIVVMFMIQGDDSSSCNDDDTTSFLAVDVPTTTERCRAPFLPLLPPIRRFPLEGAMMMMDAEMIELTGL
jgi:hypothetical protein